MDAVSTRYLYLFSQHKQIDAAPVAMTKAQRTLKKTLIKHWVYMRPPHSVLRCSSCMRTRTHHISINNRFLGALILRNAYAININKKKFAECKRL